MADKTYVANWAISSIRGKDIAPDEEVVCSEEEAEPLLACGALRANGGKAAAPAAAGDNTTDPNADTGTGAGDGAAATTATTTAKKPRAPRQPKS